METYLGELIEHPARLGLDQVQSLTWMYCASRGRTWPPPRHGFERTMLYATPEFVSAVIALPLQRMTSSSFHRRLTERLLPEWTGVQYFSGGDLPQHTPNIWDGDGLQLITELSDGTTAELTWMLDQNQVRSALKNLRRGELATTRISKANRLLTTFAVLAEAERAFSGLNAELCAVAWELVRLLTKLLRPYFDRASNWHVKPVALIEMLDDALSFAARSIKRPRVIGCARLDVDLVGH